MSAEAIATGPERPSRVPLPPMHMDDERLLLGMPYVQYSGSPSAVLGTVIGRSRMYPESQLIVEADDGRRWAVGTDMVKRQLIECGVDINAVLLWDTLSFERQAIIRALASQPTRKLDRSYCETHHISFPPKALVDLLKDRAMHVTKDSQKRYVIGNAFLKQWVRQHLGRVSPDAGLPAPVASEAEAVSLIAALQVDAGDVARALAFEPTHELNAAYCSAHELKADKANEVAWSLRRVGRVIETDHEGRLCVRGRILRRLLKGRYEGLVVKTEEEAAAMFCNAGTGQASLLRALAFYPGNPRDHQYRRLNNVRLNDEDTEKQMTELEASLVVCHQGSRYWVADRLLRAWLRGNLPRPRTSSLRAITSEYEVASLIRAADRHGLASGMRALAHEPGSKFDAAYCERFGLEGPEEIFQTIGWLALDVGAAEKNQAGKFALQPRIAEIARRMLPVGIGPVTRVRADLAPRLETMTMVDVEGYRKAKTPRTRSVPQVAITEAEIEQKLQLKLGGIS